MDGGREHSSLKKQKGDKMEELNDKINHAVYREGWNKNNLIIDEYYEIEENLCEECLRDCKRCSENTGMDYHYVEISPLTSKEKIVFRRDRSHQLGGCWSNWYSRKERIGDYL